MDHERPPCANAGGLTHAELRFAQLAAAGRVSTARDKRDDEGVAYWQAETDAARLAFAAALDACPHCSKG